MQQHSHTLKSKSIQDQTYSQILQNQIYIIAHIQLTIPQIFTKLYIRNNIQMYERMER